MFCIRHIHGRDFFSAYSAMQKCVRISSEGPSQLLFFDMLSHHRITITHRDFELQIEDIIALIEYI